MKKIKIQAVDKRTMGYRAYTYNLIKDVDNYIKMHNNSIEFVATYRVEKNEHASNRSMDDHNAIQSQV